MLFRINNCQRDLTLFRERGLRSLFAIGRKGYADCGSAHGGGVATVDSPGEAERRRTSPSKLPPGFRSSRSSSGLGQGPLWTERYAEDRLGGQGVEAGHRNNTPGRVNSRPGVEIREFANYPTNTPPENEGSKALKSSTGVCEPLVSASPR
jgi:hypothetical protein